MNACVLGRGFGLRWDEDGKANTQYSKTILKGKAFKTILTARKLIKPSARTKLN